MLTDIQSDLNKVYNAEYAIILDSSKRNVVSYPNANNFKLNLQKDMTSCIRVSLTHFIMAAGNIPGPYIYIIIDEISSGMSYAPSIGKIQFLVPGGIPAYVSQGPLNDTILMPKLAPVMIQSFTVRIVDANLNPIVITDYTMKLIARSYN